MSSQLVPQSDVSAAEGARDTTARPPAAFERRLVRAVVMLAAAVALHVWIVPAPDSPAGIVEGPLPRMALSPPPDRSAPASLLGILSRPDAAGHAATSGTERLDEAAGRGIAVVLASADAATPARVRVVQDILRIPMVAPRPGGGAPLRPAPLAARAAPGSELPPAVVAPRFVTLDPAVSGLTSELPGAVTPISAGWREPQDPTPPLRAAVRPARASTSLSPPPALHRSPSEERNPLDDDNQEARVRDVLEQYARAYGRLDVRAAQALRPSVDARALQRRFDSLNRQEMNIQDCEYKITDRGANARCAGTYSYRPKVGPAERRPAEWVFSLTRQETGWQIAAFEASLQ